MYPNTRTDPDSGANWLKREALKDEVGNQIAYGDLTKADLLAHARFLLGRVASGHVLKELIVDTPASMIAGLNTLETALDGLSYPDYQKDLGFPDGFPGDLQDGALWAAMRAITASDGRVV